MVRDNTKTVISLGFSAVLTLMFLLVYVSLQQMERLNHNISELVEETNAKMADAHTMRDAIRLRANSLKAMRLTPDPFERDEEYMRFLSLATPYALARQDLVNKHPDARERDIHERLAAATRRAQPANERAADLLMVDPDSLEAAQAMRVAEDRQRQVLALLDELVAVEQMNARAALDMSTNHYHETRRTLFMLAISGLLVCMLIAGLVVRLISNMNRRISHQASHDALTGLFNRRAFETRLQKAIDSTESRAREHALLYLDLDQFKVINDSCGHLAGDEFLRQLSTVMQAQVGPEDTLARLGGDEFGLVLMDCTRERAAEVGEALRYAIEHFHFLWEGRPFSAGVSIGIVPIQCASTSPATLLSTADTACYMAKEAGRNRIHVTTVDDQEMVRHRSEAERVSLIRAAIEENRFCLYQQAVVAAGQRDGRAPHVEVLARMIAADGSLVQPGDFIPAAERYTLMSAIDRWVVSHAMDWLEARQHDSLLPVFMINLSGQSLSDQPLLDYIDSRLASNRSLCEHLCFEITETAAVSNLATAVEFIETLKQRGCRFALDDFGAGLSSFAYLKRLPVDFLKIDGSFIRDIAVDPISRAMVRSINDIGHVMGKQTIAEFVENEDVREQVEALGIDFLQGYGIARPEPLGNLLCERRTARVGGRL